jgi:hypothetical protein
MAYLESYYIRNNRIGFDPLPDQATTVYIYYRASPDDLVSDSQEPTVPSRFHHMLANYAVTQCLRADGKIVEAREFERLWKENLLEAKHQLASQLGDEYLGSPDWWEDDEY